MNKKYALAGFTLVELMVAVCVFAVGTVFVLRSFLSSASALEALSNRTRALQLAQSQMDTLEEQALRGELKVSARAQEQVALNNRSALLETQVQEFSEEGWQKKINRVDVRVRWEEAGREKYVTLACFVKNNK